MRFLLSVFLLAFAATFAYGLGIVILGIAYFTYPFIHAAVIAAKKVFYVGKPAFYGLLAIQ